MKKGVFLLLIISVLFFSACNDGSSDVDNMGEDKLKVYTSFYTLYDFASKIGGEHAQVVNMIPPGGEPHHWEPTAADIVSLEGADIFIYNGLSLEHWVESVLEPIENENLIVVEASQDVDVLESSHSHDDHNHSHNNVDPHIWLDPIKSKTMMKNIRDAFIELDPLNEGSYENNYNIYVEELEKLDSEFHEKLVDLNNRDMIVSHEAFTYLSEAYGLHQIPIEGLIPDSEPNPSRMAEIIDYINDNNIETIFFEDENDTKVVETISNETGVNFTVLYTLEYLTDRQISNGDDYFSVMRSNLEALVKGLE